MIISYNRNNLEDNLKLVLQETDLAHGFLHAQNVWQIAKQIAVNESTEVDLDVLHAACMFHDTGYIKISDYKNSNEHPQKSVEIAQDILPKVNFPQEKHELTLKAIAEHDATKPWWPHKQYSSEKEIQYLQDADNVEALGAIGLTRLIIYSSKRGMPLFVKKTLPDVFTGTAESIIENIKSHMDHLYGGLHTKTAKDLAKHRLKIMQNFVDCFLRELSE